MMTSDADSADRSGAKADFDFRMGTRIVFGPGKLDVIGSLAAELGGRRVLLVSDPGIVKAGHVGRAIERLREAGCETSVFDGTAENPTTEHVDRGVLAAREFGPDLLVGLGGGSSMDCAKGINFLLTNGGRMQDYWGVGKAHAPMLPMIAVPTTAGTGSELQSFALISDAVTHAKMACGDRKATCRIALLDPELTLTQPPRVTALTGVDAVSHAIESAVTRPRTAMSMTFSRRSFSLLCEALPRVFAAPDDLAARADVQLGASLAGLAIENSMLGVAHSLANPLTARYDIPHGQAVGVMLPAVVRFNAPVVGRTYAELERELVGEGSGKYEPGERLAIWLEELLRTAGLASRLSELGVERERLSELAEGAHKQWTKGFNPREVRDEDPLRLYEQAF